MCLNYQKQRGSALVIAVFIIVVMLALAVGLSRLLISSSETVVYEVQGTRAFFAAQSGLEMTLPRLFPLDAAPLTTCPADISAPIGFDDTALNSCSVVVSCRAFPVPVQAEGNTLFQLESTANCTADGFQTRRKVQIEVRG